MSRERSIERSEARPADEGRRVATRLEEANAFAAAGDRTTAREICAHLVHDGMMRIAADPALLARLADVLLLAGGVEQLARVLRAVGGLRVDILCSKSLRLATGRDLATHVADGGIRVMLDESVVGRSVGKAGEDVVRAVTNQQNPLR